MKFLDKLKGLNKFAPAISFLAMEIFALIAFSFGGSFVLYGSLSLALVILLIIFNIKELTLDGISSIALFIIPLFLFVLLTAVGTFSRYNATVINTISIADIVFVPLGLLPVAFCGYLLSNDFSFKLSTFLLVTFSALALLSLINLIANMVNLGAFYPFIYKGYHMYFAGKESSVTVDQFAYVLEGFSFIEVKMSRYILFPALLLTSSAGLIFINPKENVKMFAIYAVFTFIAILSLILVPSILGLLCAIGVAIVDLLAFLIKHFKLPFKPFKIAIIVILAGLGIVLSIMFLNTQSFSSGVHDALAGNSFLNRLFCSNKFVNEFNPFLENLFSNSKFLGFAGLDLSGSFLFDNLMTSGLLGGIAFLVILYLGFKGFYLYIKHGDRDELYVKVALLTFVLLFFGYSLAFNSGSYGIFYQITQPIYMSGPFLLALFVLAYVYCSSYRINEKLKSEMKNTVNPHEEATSNE